MVIQGVSYASDFEAKKAMIELGRRMAEKAYVIAEDGSMSVRVGPNAVWITARGASCASLTQNDFVRVDLNGKQMFSAHPRPLPEDLPVHLKVYTTNPQMQSVVHAYPVEVAVLTAQGRDVQPAAYTPAVRALGRVRLLASAAADVVAEEASLACKTDCGVLLPGDGCILWGATLCQAYHKLEALTYYVKVTEQLHGGCEKNGACCAGGRNGCSSCSAAVSCPTPVQTEPVPAPVAIPGLTPLVRPGHTAAFAPPVSQPAPAAPVSAPAVPATPQPAPEIPAAAVPATQVPRETVMAEVVRRALLNMK